MAAIVCHQSYMESRIQGLMLASPKPLPPTPQDLPLKFNAKAKPQCDENSYKPDSPLPNQCHSGWSSIQALSSVSVSKYVHSQAQVKLSSVRLSPKSLELCTENLGNETGSDIIESGIELTLLSSSSECGGAREQKRKAREARSFPPPLTTIRGSESIRVRPHREDGRLVLEVTKVPFPSCFQAERSPGRLRLGFWTEKYDDQYEDIQTQEDDVDVDVDVEDNQEDDEVEKIEQEQEEGVDNDIGENVRGSWEHTKACNTSWSVEGVVVRAENTYEIRPSSSRCKEGGHEFLNELGWGEPRWVATS